MLSKYADLLEIEGEDLFRVIAYRNAARTIESLSQPVAQLLAEGKDLKKLKLPGIGKSMAEHIQEIVTTGTLKALTQIRKRLPTKLDELLAIEGLGPKRTKQLYEKLGIGSIDQARRGWLEKRHVINAMTLSQLEIWLKQRTRTLLPIARSGL